MRLRVQALGDLRVYAGARGMLPITGPSRSVLGYLLTNRNRQISRIELAESLWADHDGHHARRCLSTALWRLKKAVGAGPPLLASRGVDDVSFNWGAPAWVDAVALEWRAQPLLRLKPESLGSHDIERLERGVRLYRGDYLVGIDHEWALVERQRLRNLYCDALYHLALAHSAAERWPRVIEWARRLNREEPLREDVHRLLMRAYEATGNRGKAMLQYFDCAKVMRDELGVEPMAETQELCQQISRSAQPSKVADEPKPDAGFADAYRRIARVRRVLAASERQLVRALESLNRPDRIN